MDSLDDVCNSFHSCHGFAVHLVDSFSLFCFWDVLERLGCLGMFLGCLGTSCIGFELRYDDDPMMELPRVMRKMAMPYEKPCS